jgi:hypothetical protein|nr:Orn/Lys/Arg decarboxylase N-terminal domain-containing protein [Pseudomonas fluorescens]
MLAALKSKAMRQFGGNAVNGLKIAASLPVRNCFRTSRDIVTLDQTDYTDVAVAVFSRDDVLAGALETIKHTGFDIPIFLVASQGGVSNALGMYKQLQDVLLQVNGVFDLSRNNVEYYGHHLETAAKSYEDTLLPPFFNALKQYTTAAQCHVCLHRSSGRTVLSQASGRPAVLRLLWRNVVSRRLRSSTSAAMSSGCRWLTLMAASPPKAPCPTHRAFYAWCPGKSAAARY